MTNNGQTTNAKMIGDVKNFLSTNGISKSDVTVTIRTQITQQQTLIWMIRQRPQAFPSQCVGEILGSELHHGLGREGLLAHGERGIPKRAGPRFQLVSIGIDARRPYELQPPVHKQSLRRDSIDLPHARGQVRVWHCRAPWRIHHESPHNHICRKSEAATDQRRGVIVVLNRLLDHCTICLHGLSVDTGRVVLTETENAKRRSMPRRCRFRRDYGRGLRCRPGQGSANIDANSIAVSSARAMAADVAHRNGVYVDPTNDVQFGKTGIQSLQGSGTIQWGATPYSVVKVTARRTNANTAAPDGQFPLAFVGRWANRACRSRPLRTAFVEARDLVLVLDYSASMDDDSSLVSDSRRPKSIRRSIIFGAHFALRSEVARNHDFPSSSHRFRQRQFGCRHERVQHKCLDGSEHAWPQHEREWPPQVSVPAIGPQCQQRSEFKGKRRLERFALARIHQLCEGPQRTYNKKYGYRTLMDYLQEQRYDPASRKISGGRPSIRIRPSKMERHCS